ncbi:type II toxin-antitoxin system PemK/MazF family toxin [Paenibacillus sp. N1-5-1-14]|uniref:type II toxin-antitoxin system PemK/MazF family toxin n=1 Tax=Paenibacillus radicibacter TaxID=2972488 RepID=UPI002159043F|nr:type II toxin-antitoxin system PemK/MazF family toxin [Paenibacillus radicibacter]MCR8641559.1 type II toxin-antitoxin system PemK/MazF family toxin [Paenibacillus radicibacter]
MADNPSISEVWKTKIYYKGTSGSGKIRPVLVVNYEEDSDLYTIQEITSVEPKEPPTHYDGLKQVISKWKEAGLDEKSYVKCSHTNTHKIGRVRLRGYIGILDEEDFETIIERIYEAKARLTEIND